MTYPALVNEDEIFLHLDWEVDGRIYEEDFEVSSNLEIKCSSTELFLVSKNGTEVKLTILIPQLFN